MLFLGIAVCSHVLHVCILGYLCPCFSLRLKSLKQALFNMYLASFLGPLLKITELPTNFLVGKQYFLVGKPITDQII